MGFANHSLPAPQASGSLGQPSSCVWRWRLSSRVAGGRKPAGRSNVRCGVRRERAAILICAHASSRWAPLVKVIHSVNSHARGPHEARAGINQTAGEANEDVRFQTVRLLLILGEVVNLSEIRVLGVGSPTFRFGGVTRHPPAPPRKMFAGTVRGVLV
ncbi:hypothetical protein BaRGS_00001743 [Batillaria attramentaria]|uniref:Uncharacterized protein n=1 Tax=Batillaria attramentaria TaxID=370345 RepID=A0ABD0M6H6_9CAEN